MNRIKKLSILLPTVLLLTAYKADPPKSTLAPMPFREMPLGAIKPRGWLHDQLETMAKGTSGHLDEVYNRVKNDNGWLGGKRDGGEETPYWLDGALPLAWLLDDATLKTKVLQYVNWTIDHQRSSGYFGPLTKAELTDHAVIDANHADLGEDWWPKMIMLKVIQQYYTATNDKRIIPFFTKYFHYQLAALKKAPINKWSQWAESRGTENIMIAQWLYGITHDAKLLELDDLITKQSFPWSNLLGGRDWAINSAAQQNDVDWMQRHGVNVAMALKAPALDYERTHNPAYLRDLKTGFTDIMKLDGLPMGMFSADEDLHGNLPTQGTELCAIVESMFSLEEIIAITGDPGYMDALERMTFNALPTQTTDDYNNKQYFQVANQVEIARGVFDFSLPFDRQMNNVLGMRSGYTCCLANMHQGWAKYATHLWYQTSDNGLAALVYGPNQVTASVGDKKQTVTIDEVTDYPFNDEISFNIATQKSVAFPMQLRIPGWCKEASIFVNGKLLQTGTGGKLVTIKRTWSNSDKLQLKMPMQVTTSNWGRNSRAIERGPLVYALKLGEKWEKGNDAREGDYFSVYPIGNWNYGLVEKTVSNPLNNLKVNQLNKPAGPFVWNLAHAPIEITATARQLPDWQLTDGVANQPVTNRDGIYKGKVSDSTTTITLVPYGFTKVRIVAFPVVK